MSYGMLRLLTVYSRRGGASVIRHVTLVDSLLGRGGVERVIQHVTFVDSLLGRGGVERVSYDMLRLLTVYPV